MALLSRKEKTMLEEINRVCSLQNTQNNPPALCSVSSASQEHCIHFKSECSWAAMGWSFWEVQDTSIKGKDYSKHHKAPERTARKERVAYLTLITDCPSEWVGQTCHGKASNHSTWIAVTPHTQEGHLPAQFLMDSVFHGIGGESPGNESRGFTALSPTLLTLNPLLGHRYLHIQSTFCVGEDDWTSFPVLSLAWHTCRIGTHI